MLPTDTLVKFILCENAREDKGGKVSLLGVFPDDQILLPADARFPAAFPLALVFFLVDGTGSFPAEFEVQGPRNQPTFQGKLPDVQKPPNNAATVVATFSPFIATQFGKYLATLILSGQRYVRSFDLAPAPTPS